MRERVRFSINNQLNNNFYIRWKDIIWKIVTPTERIVFNASKAGSKNNIC